MSRNTLMMTTKTMIQVGHQLVLRISFCVLEVRTVFGRPGFVTTRTIVPAARTNLRKSVQIDLFVTKTCSGNILSYKFLHFTSSLIDFFLLFFPMSFYEIRLDLNSLTYYLVSKVRNLPFCAVSYSLDPTTNSKISPAWIFTFFRI